MMRHERNVRLAKGWYTVFSLCLCLFGLLLVLSPELSLAFVTNGAGMILICFGGVKIWGHFTNDLYRLAFQNGMASGSLAAAVGVYLLARSEAGLSSLCVILGLTALADALTKIEMSIDAKKFGLSPWWVILAVGILTGVIGFLLIPQPWEERRQPLGLALLAEGGLNLITALTTIRFRERLHPGQAVLEEESPWGI